MQVHVLTIDHKHGTDTYVHATRAGADAAIATFVAEWWNAEMDESMPDDPATAVAIYFERNEGIESYNIDECEVAA